MKKFTIAIIMLAGTISNAFATAQFPDRVFYEGEMYMLHTNPMESYFIKHPDKRPRGNVMSTALNRGYVATFEFKTNALLLKDIKIRISEDKDDGKWVTSWKSVRDDFVPKDGTLLVDWFTGILVLPHGTIVEYVHGGYGSTYSDYILLEIKEGRLKDKRAFDHKQLKEFKKQQFQAFKETEDYRKQAETFRSRNRTQEEIDSIIGYHILSYISEFLGKEEKKEQPSNKPSEAIQ